MKSLLETEVFEEILERIDALEEKSEGNWGKMSVGQMVWHCQYPLKLAIENKDHSKKGNFLIKLFFKKSLYNDKPWRKNLPTSPIMKTKEDKDLESERIILKSLVTNFHAQKDRTEWHPHPIFGTFTPEQWGQLEYKHIDHHLRQFGV
ncbi:MAG: DUF1569 domain-containing protein [Eudoraea sp.]|nr:DUF1569 domain-containing protein [Eudoraea sp.]